MKKTLIIQSLQDPFLLITVVIIIFLAIAGFVLMYRKGIVKKMNLANAKIIQTKTFDELLKVITSHEVRSQHSKLSDIIYRQFERVTRREFEKLKDSEDYVSIVKLFYSITTSYNWGNNFDTELYQEFCIYLETNTAKLLNEDQDKEHLLRNVIELSKISLELDCFFQSKKNYSQTGIVANGLRKRFNYLKSEMLNQVTA